MTIKFSIIPSAALFDERLSPQQLRTLGIICFFGAQKDEGCWPSYNTLSLKIGISRRLVIEYINHLCSCGYIVKESRDRNNGGKSSNVYHVPLDICIGKPTDKGGDAGLHHPSDAGLHGGGDAGLHQLYMNDTKLEPDKKNINKKAKSTKITLAQWEENKGTQLCVEMMMNWCKENDLDPAQVKKAIPAFRERMQSGENLYANFIATFQVWLRNGYLPIKIEQAKRKTTTHGDGTVIIDRGLTL